MMLTSRLGCRVSELIRSWNPAKEVQCSLDGRAGSGALRLAEDNKLQSFQEKPVTRLGKIFGPVLILLFCFAGASFAQDSAKQDVKDAGHETKQAAQDVGRATKKTAKKTGHTVKKGTNKAAQKTEQGAKKVEDKTKPE